jgi:serine/threonine protein kinase
MLYMMSSIVLNVVSSLALQHSAVDPQGLVLGEKISSGKYGTCQWAQLEGMQCVVKRASAEFSEPSKLERDRERASEYLETEEMINGLLLQRALGTQSSLDSHKQTVAPYIGTCIKDGTRYLVWQAAGDETLDSFLQGGGQRLPELARALGCDEENLSRSVLHDVMRCLAHVHACGVAHRDLKPANLVVDSSSQTLKLIDFGSAADCAGWLHGKRRGWQIGREGQNIPCSKLFAASSTPITFAA